MKNILPALILDGFILGFMVANNSKLLAP